MTLFRKAEDTRDYLKAQLRDTENRKESTKIEVDSS